MKIVRETEAQFQKAHSTDAGYDIVANQDITIREGDQALVSTGLKVAIPDGYVGILKSRSGLAVKHRIEVGAGVIDCGYTGEVKVLLHNNSPCRPFIVQAGDKIAQMVVLPIYTGFANIVDSLEDTDRNEGGFGSTGK